MYIKFTKPSTLDGKQLLAELNAGGVAIEELPSIDFNGDFWLNINEADVTKATPIVAAHTVKPMPEPTVEEKLSSVGLSVADLKTALGL